MNQKTQNENVKVGIGVFVIIFNSDYSKILMVKRNKEKVIRWGAEWGNLGGSLELREYSVDGAIREAREEAGIGLEKSKVKLLEVIELPNYSDKYHGISFVYATVLDEDTPIRINSESDGYKWFKLNKLPDSMLDKKEDIFRWRNEAMRLFE